MLSILSVHSPDLWFVLSRVVSRTDTYGTNSIPTRKKYIDTCFFLVPSEPNIQLFPWRAVSILGGTDGAVYAREQLRAVSGAEEENLPSAGRRLVDKTGTKSRVWRMHTELF